MSVGESVSVSLLCRACMIAVGPHIKQNLDTDIRIKFTHCTGIQIDKNDGLPLNICNECIKNVDYCYSFITDCKKTDRLLKKYISEKNVIINDEKNSVKEENFESDKEDKCFQDNDVNDDDLSDYNVPLQNVEVNILRADDIKVEPCTEKEHNLGSVQNSNKNRIAKKHKVVLKKAKKKIKINAELKNISNCGLAESKTKKTYTCPVCSDAFIGKTLFKTHLSEQHADYKKFICNICSKAFSKSQYLNQHLVIHTGSKPYACDICPKVYKQHGQLITHRRTHSKEKPYKCDKCDMSFYMKCGMMNHSKQHEGSDHHLCHLCGQGFTQLGNLMVHMRVHTGEKPYSCSLCSFRCSVQSGMRRHERKHANLRNHICSVCHKAFNNSGSLARHSRIHTGELPYKCSYCPKAFIDSWKRKNHMMKEHNLTLSDIPKMFPGRKRIYTNIVSNDSSSNIKSEPACL